MDGYEACGTINIFRKQKKLKTPNFKKTKIYEYDHHWIQFKVNLISYSTHNKPSNTGK